jgi:hypothetical protein
LKVLPSKKIGKDVLGAASWSTSLEAVIMLTVELVVPVSASNV